jgi:hypothetical protein
MSIVNDIAEAMIRHEAGCRSRVAHFLKVAAYARLIASQETDDSQLCQLIELAALTHDIGIKPSLAKYGSATGPQQEKEGPPLAQILFADTGLAQEQTSRICWLIGHHHTLQPIDGLDHQIIIEADFLVNADEGALPIASVKKFRDEHFRTKTGTRLLNLLFDLD